MVAVKSVDSKTAQISDLDFIRDRGQVILSYCTSICLKRDNQSTHIL